MKKKPHDERRERIGLIIILSILVLFLALIGFLIYRIAHMNDRPTGLLQSVQSAQEAPTPQLTPIPEPAVIPEPTPEPEPEPTPEPEPEPTPEPTPEPEPEPEIVENFKKADSALIQITKQPGGESLNAGNTAVFVAHANGAAKREWRFVSPEFDREIIWNDPAVQTEFPGLACEGGDTDTLILYHVPRELSGWSVVCLFTDADNGMFASEGAGITVN